MNLCSLCQCLPEYNFHHLIPKRNHSNKWFKKKFTKEELNGGISVCEECHEAIHKIIPNHKNLGRDYNTLSKLLEHQKIQNHIQWMKDKND